MRLDGATLRLAVELSGRRRQAHGMKVGAGTIIDAPSSTKNAQGERAPEMHQARKGQQWYFGMKLHIGVDTKTGLAHSAVVTPANAHDKHPLPGLLHGNEQQVFGDSAYASQQELMRSKAPLAKDCTNQRVRRAARPQVLTDPQPHQVQGEIASRARLRCRQAPVGLRQGALPGLGEDRHAPSWLLAWPTSTWRASA